MKRARRLSSHLLSSSMRRILRLLLRRTVSVVLSAAMAAGQLSLMPSRAFGTETTIPAISDATTGAPTVVREMSELRTETSKHYLLSDGRQRAVITGAPQHYLAADATWRDIDTSLGLVETGAYRTSAASITSEFGCERAGTSPVSLSTRDWSVGIDLVGAIEGRPVAVGDSALYSEVSQDADLLYQSLPDGLKETVVLKSPRAPSTYTFKLTLDGVTLNRLPVGGYGLVSTKTGTLQAVMGQLEVFDSAPGQPARCDDATMTVVTRSDGTYVTCQVDPGWLASPDRVFPVMVDPTFTSLFDTFVNSGYPTSSFGAATGLVAGDYGASLYNRSLVHFDVSSVAGAEIYSAGVSLYQYDTSHPTGTWTAYLARATSAWNESTTWNTKPGYTYVASTAGSGTRNVWLSYNVKTTVQAWLAGTYPNYGFVYYQKEDGTQDNYWRKFYSSEYSDGSKRPKLVIDYNAYPADISTLSASTNAGLDWWRASSASAPDDLRRAGRGEVTLDWARPARAEGYNIWAFDGNGYQKVGTIDDPRYTSWSSSAAQMYPPDTEIASKGDDAWASNPFYRSAAPGNSTRIATATISVEGPANTGVVATDGTYLYTRPISGSDSWYRIGNGIESTATVAQIGSVTSGSLTGFYLDGFLYNSYAYTPTTIKGMWKNASDETTATKVLEFSEPLLHYTTGAESAGSDSGILLCTDGERIYNAALEIAGTTPSDGYRIRVYDKNGNWIEDKDIPMVSNYCDSVFTDGDAIYFMKWGGAGQAETTVDKISLTTWQPVNRWKITDVTGSTIGGCYDAANDCFFLGTYEDTEIHKFAGPGLDLRDNPNALYGKTQGDTYDDRVNYYFRVTSYNYSSAGTLRETSVGNCPAYTPTLPNRSVTAEDDPRHTTEDLGSFAGHSLSGVLDEGRLQVEVEDLSVASYGPSVSLSRVYRSDDTSPHGFACGWRFSFDQSIETSGTTHKTWIDASGERHIFSYATASGVWVAPPGLTASMTSDAAGTTVELSDHTEMAFAALDGRLESITDRRGDQVTFVEAGDDLVITAENGRSITVERDATGNVLSASDGTREVSYETSGTASVTYFPSEAEERVVEYDYSSSRLSGIAVPDWPTQGEESAFTFTYDAANRVSEAREPGYATDTDKKAAISYNSAAASVARTGEVSGTEAAVTNSYTWNPNGTTATKTDPKVAGDSDATWSYTYAPNNELTLEVSPTGAKKTRVVDAKGNLLYDYDELGHRSAYYYNEEGDCVREVDPRGAATYRSFDAAGNITREEKVLTAAGERSVTAWEFGDHGLASSESRRASATETYTTEYEYDISGQVATETVLAAKLATSTAQDLTTRKVFDDFGNVVADYDASGSLVTSSSYDLAGRVVASQDASGTVTHHVYDALGNEIESWRSHESTGTKADWSIKSYDAMGRVVTEIALLHDGSTTVTQTTVTHTYDPMGRETETDDVTVSGNKAHNHYDARGNNIKSWPEGVPAYNDARSTRTDYDVYGRQWRTYEPGTTNVASTFTYFADGEVRREERDDGSWTDFTYDDGSNKLTELTSGAEDPATFSYDVAGRLVSETDADGAVTTHTYDLLGRETAAQGEGPASEIMYNTLGNAISKTDADGIRTETTYDAAGRVIRDDTIATGVAPKTTTTSYDGCGRTVSTTDPDGKVLAYAYDLFGRAVSEKHCTEAGTVKDETRAYDSLGRASVTLDLRSGVTRSFAYPANQEGPTVLRTSCAGVVTTTTVAADGREQSRVSSAAGAQITRTSGLYDTAGRETTWSVGSQPYTRSFNDAGQLTDWSSSGVSGSIGYDDAAKKASESYSGGLGSAISSRFTYTDGGRLSSTYRSGVGTETLSFDAAGNLTTSTVGGVATVMTYDPATQRLINRQVGSEVTTYTFDALGRRIAQGPLNNPNAEVFSYTGTGRLASYDSSSGVHATYAYDAVGQRTRRSVFDGSLSTTTTYTYEGLNLLSLSATRSDGATWSVSYLYDASGRAYAGVYEASDASATAFQMVTTDRGDVVELLDTSGASFAAYHYDEWGLATETTSAATGLLSASVAEAVSNRQPLRYAGYCFDAEEGFCYLSARTYDPISRQFMSKDPAKADGEESAYQYCGGDPVGNVDPNGELAMKYLSYSSYISTRSRIVARAEYILQNATSYVLGGKNERGGIDCSGLVTRIMTHAGVFPAVSVLYWNSGEIYRQAPTKGVPTVNSFNSYGASFRIGDVLHKDGTPGHVAIVVTDGSDPYIVESAPRYGGPKKHHLSARWPTWKPTHSARYFLKVSPQVR